LTGPGGIGKTTLALEVARCMLPAFHGDVWLVELASLADPDLVPSTVARAIGLKLASGEILPETVARAIGERKLLLVLDNCEHVIDASASLAEAVVRLCPAASVLATSREILRIAGEYIFQVPPLNVPPPRQDGPDLVLRHSAVQLFVARARALRSEFSPNDGSLSAIAAICRRLDGIPLAIEFAAARAATLGVQQVASGLDERFKLLTGGRRPALPRHQTLRATLDWSYELLPEPERRLLRYLAVFPGGFTAEAATAIMHDVADAVSSVVVGIANLVTKSLVVLVGSAPVGRWRLFETTRAYALEKLAEHGETETVFMRHAVYFRDLVTPPASGTRSSLSDDDLTRCVVEIDNVRAALDWSFSSAGDPTIGVALTAAYAPVWQHLVLIKECVERCERALPSLEAHGTGDMRVRMRLHLALASALFATMGPASQAITILTEALDAADTLNDIDAQTRALSALSDLRHLYIHRGEYGLARIVAERLGQMADRVDDPVSVRAAWRRIGASLLTSGRPREAQQYFERVLRSPLTPGDRHDVTHYNSNDRADGRAMLSRALWMQGFTERALNEARASLEELHGADHQLLLCRTLYVGICRIAPMVGDFATADREIARLIDVATSLDAHFWETAGRFLKGKLLVERGEFAQGLLILRGAFETCGRTGWRLSYPEFKGALALAFAGLGRLDEALGALEDAVASAGEGENGEVWYVPELLRIKGEVLLLQAPDRFRQAAEDCFIQAAEMAREHGALFWELRIAVSIARLTASQGRHHEARALLQPVYDRFSEGFDTTDLKEAKALLDALAAPGALRRIGLSRKT
jgi:predicted ATPase